MAEFEPEIDTEVDDEDSDTREDQEVAADPDQLDPAQNIENKVKKLALKYGKGQTSYIYWPCTMDISDDVRLHMTCKFFGDTPILVDEIRDVIEKIEGFDEPLNIEDFEWEPVVFATQNDGGVPVLEFKKFPEILNRLHSAFSRFRRDDYDSYKPHITVTQEVWEQVQEEELTPKDVNLEFQPLEISIRGLVKYKWGPDAGPVEEIDGEDVHTNNPTGESFAQKTIRGIQSLSGK